MTDVKRPYTLPPGQRGPMRRELAPMPAIPRQSDFGIHEVSFLDDRYDARADGKVWADNLETEFAALRAAVDKYPFISMVGSQLVTVN